MCRKKATEPASLDMKTARDFLSCIRHATHARGVRRSDLKDGDVLILYTQNSVYTARKIDATRFVITGGWFDAHGQEGVATSIVGCTWGGSSIHREFVASCGMRVEFGNRVLTSTLQKVVRIPAALLN